MKENLGIILSLACIFVSAAVSAQTIPIDTKFGSVSKEEVEMTTYAPDTSAVAVYLYRNDDVLMDFTSNGLTRTTTYRRRIKILKESGKDYADFQIRYSNKTYENISNVKVITYNLENGKVTETKMGKDCIFHKNVNESTKELSFTAQNVKVGSVIEVQYKKISAAYYYIPDLYFQFSIPVNFAEATVTYPEYFRFRRVSKGYNPLQADRRTENRSVSLRGGILASVSITDVYSIKDVPALREEPMVYSTEQYQDHVVYELSTIEVPGSILEDYSSNWGKVDASISKWEFFKAFSGKALFKDETDAILAGEGTEEQKIVAVRDLVCDRIEWDHIIGFHVENPAQLLKNKSGNGPDINCQVAAALNRAGYLAEPVLVRLRESGPILDYNISASEFDTFILRIQTPEGKVYYLDAPQGDTYLNVQDEAYLVSKARLLHMDGKGEWVDLSSLTPNKASILVSASLSEDGEISAEFTETLRGQYSQSYKEGFNSFDKEDEFISAYEAKWGVEVDSFNAAEVKDFTVDTNVKMSLTKNCNVSGNLVYVSPFFETFHKDGLFKDEVRRYPVEFPYQGTIAYTMMLKYPETWTVEQMPKTTLIKGEGVESTVTARFANSAPGTIVVRVTVNEKDGLILQEQYPNLRLFWDGVCNLYKEMIILRKP